MAIGMVSDLTIYQDEFYAGMFEAIVQNIQAFNGASANAIRLVDKDKKGQYNKESYFKTITSLITRRDLTSVAAVTDKAMTQGEIIGVKIDRKIGPVAMAISALKKITSDSREMSFILGEMYGEEKLKDILNTSIKGVEAAIEGQVALVYDATGQSTKTLTHTHLVSGLAKMGDQASRVLCWVMYSKPYFDLVKQSLSDKITNVADVTVYKGTAATLGRPTVVTDSPALFNDNSGTDTYNVLGLVANSVVATESEDEEIASEIVTGLEQLAFRIQGEYAFNLECKGFKWNTSVGGTSPLDTAIATTTNWTKSVTENKDLAGVRILVQ